MRHDTIAMMRDPTHEELERADASVKRVSMGTGEGHTPESFALQTSNAMGPTAQDRDDNWRAALVRLERAENARPGDASPLTTIDRVRHLNADIQLQDYAREIAEDRRNGVDPHAWEPDSHRKGMGKAWGGDIVSRMKDLGTESLEQLASGKGVSNARDAVLVGSMMAGMVDKPHRDLDGMTADRLGIRRTRGLMDRIAGRSERDIALIAPAEERTRMMEIEDAQGVARGRGPAATEGPRVAVPTEWHLAVHGAERHTNDFLQGGERLEQRIASETRTLRELDDRKLATTFRQVMPRGSIPENPRDRDRWIDAALRNERMIVASGVADGMTIVNAVMRDRGPVGPGPETAMPTGGLYSGAFQDSQAVAKNLEFTTDNMLRRRFGQVHGMDHIRIPEDPDMRRSWIHQTNMLSVAAKFSPAMAAGQEQDRPVMRDRSTEIDLAKTKLRPAAAMAMMDAQARGR